MDISRHILSTRRALIVIDVGVTDVGVFSGLFPLLTHEIPEGRDYVLLIYIF